MEVRGEEKILSRGHHIKMGLKMGERSRWWRVEDRSMVDVNGEGAVKTRMCFDKV